MLLRMQRLKDEPFMMPVVEPSGHRALPNKETIRCAVTSTRLVRLEGVRKGTIFSSFLLDTSDLEPLGATYIGQTMAKTGQERLSLHGQERLSRHDRETLSLHGPTWDTMHRLGAAVANRRRSH